jgi:opacity protein-like surface antigen
MWIKKVLLLAPALYAIAGPVIAQTGAVESGEMSSVFGRKGFYVGLAGGSAFNPGSTDWEGHGFAQQGLQRLGQNASSGTGMFGLYFGYRIPLTASWVVGPEADINYIGEFRKHDTLTYNYAGGGVAPAGTYQFHSGREGNYFGTLRGHFGYTFHPEHYGYPFNPVEVYLSGGLAYAGNSGGGTGNATYTSPAGAQTTFVGRGSDTHTGSVFGLGVQYGFTSNIDARLEYMYVKLKTDSHTFTPPGGGPSYYLSDDVKGTFNVLRVGVAYHF